MSSELAKNRIRGGRTMAAHSVVSVGMRGGGLSFHYPDANEVIKTQLAYRSSSRERLFVFTSLHPHSGWYLESSLFLLNCGRKSTVRNSWKAVKDLIGSLQPGLATQCVYCIQNFLPISSSRSLLDDKLSYCLDRLQSNKSRVFFWHLRCSSQDHDGKLYWLVISFLIANEGRKVLYRSSKLPNAWIPRTVLAWNRLISDSYSSTLVENEWISSNAGNVRTLY